MGHHGGDQRAGDVKSGKEQKAQRQIHRCGRDHKPLVILKMAEDGAVAAEHPVVPADILIQAEHQHKAEGQQPLLTHPGRHERLEQAEVGRGHKAGKQVAEQVHAPEYLLVVVVGGSRFVVDDVADGGRKAVHDLVAEVGGRGGNGIVVAQKGRLG